MSTRVLRVVLITLCLFVLQISDVLADPLGENATDVGNATEDATVEMTVGVLLPFVVDYSLLAFVALWDLDFRKQFEPDLVQRFGPQLFPIPEASRFPGLRVRVTTGETGGNEAIGVWAAQSMLYGPNGPLEQQARGMVGLMNSVVAMPVATYVSANPTPMIATGIGATALSDKERFPYFFRLNANSAVGGLYMWLYFDHFNFKSCSILYVGEDFSSSHYESFMRKATEAKRDDAVHAVMVPYALTNTPSDHNNWLYAINNVKQRRTRLVMTLYPLLMVSTFYPFILQNGLHPPEYQTLSTYSQLSLTEYSPLMTGSHVVYPYFDQSDERLTRLFGMFLRMNSTDILSQLERYGVDKWFPADPRLSFQPARMQDSLFRQMPVQTSILVGVLTFNALHMYTRAFGELLLSGVPPEQVRGEVLRQKLRTMQFAGIGGMSAFDDNQDGLTNSTIMSYTMQPDPQNNGSWIPSVAPLCLFVMTLHNGTTSLTLRPTGVPVLWANGEPSTSAPDELTACPPGQFQAAPHPDSTKEFGTCVDCQLGRYTNESDQLECTWCPAGKYGMANRTGCTDCPAGTYNPDRGASICAGCNVGSAQSSVGSSACDLCPLGQYANERSLTECKQCQAREGSTPRTTEFLGASSPEVCFCPAGFYEGLLGECTRCDVESLACPVGTSLLPHTLERHGHKPAALPGFMLMPDEPAGAYKCNPSHHCPGGLASNCSGGRLGIACGECPENAIANNGDCRECKRADTVIVVLLAIGLVFFSFGMYYVTNGANTNRAVATIGWSSSISTTVMAVQVIGLFERLSLPFPNMASEFVHASAVVSVDITSLLPLRCVVGSTSFWLYFLTVAIFPTIICVLLCILVFSWFLAGKGFVRETSRFPWQIEKVHNTMGVFMQAFFIVMSTIAATPMMCYRHPNGRQSVMRYPHIICGEGGHGGMLAVGVMLMLFAVAFFGYASLLVIEAPRLQARWGNTGFFRRTRFLVLLYRVDRMYWGLCVMLRSLVLTFIPVWAPDSPRVQQLILSTVIMVYTPVLCAKWPWKIPAMNMLDACTCIVILFIVMVAGMSNAPPTATETRAFEGLINASVVAIYLINGLVIVACLAAVLVRGRYVDLHPWFFLLRAAPRRDELCKRFLEVSSQVNSDQASKPGSFEKSVRSWQQHDLWVLREIVEVLASNGIASRGSTSSRASISRASSDTDPPHPGSSRWSGSMSSAESRVSQNQIQDQMVNWDNRVKWEPSMDSISDVDAEELVLKVSPSRLPQHPRDKELPKKHDKELPQ